MLSVDRQRLLDRRLGPPLCWLLTLWHRVKPRQPAAATTEVRRVLVIVLSEMGALVLARPMFDRLRERYPRAQVHVLCFERNREALDVLDVVPPHRIVGLRAASLVEFLRDALRVIRQLRTLRFDVVLDLELFSRTSAIFSGLSGAPTRVGFERHTQEGLYRGGFINRPVAYNPYHHISTQFLALADAIEVRTVPAGKWAATPPARAITPLVLQPGELDAARRALHARSPGIGRRPLVLLCPGAGLLPVRAWPVDHYVTTARALLERGFAVAIVGLADDRDLGDAIRRACASEACVDLTGSTRSVRDLVVLLHLGALLIANDGGTAHLAALTPTPSIVLYGPETPVLYGTLSPHTVHLHRSLACSPCLTAYNHRRSPCDGDNTCLKTIEPSEVLAVAERLLRTPAWPLRLVATRPDTVQ